MMGILVDKVSEVIKMASENIEDAPSFGTDVNPQYLLGMGKTGGRICLLLDIEKVIMASDIINMKKDAEGSGQRPKDEKNQIQTN